MNLKLRSTLFFFIFFLIDAKFARKMNNKFLAIKGKELSELERGKIIALSEEGQSVRQISKNLGHPKSTVQDTITHYKIKGNVEDEYRSGCPSSFDEKAIKYLEKMIKNNPKITSEMIQEKFFEIGIRVSTKTIRTSLHKIGFYSHISARKPFLTETQQQNRFNWCIERNNWMIEDWNKVIWSDESRFCLFHDGPRRVWRQKGERFDVENLMPTVKSGERGVMVWGCFCGTGLGPLVLVEGKLNHLGYIELLEKNLLPWIYSKFNHRKYFFQHDNAPVHTAKGVKTWISENNIKMLPNWPAQSPDLNPIENLWDTLQKQVRNRDQRPANIHELYAALQEEWERIPRHTYRKLINSMPKRVDECIEKQGAPTSY
jgi:transposase